LKLFRSRRNREQDATSQGNGGSIAEVAPEASVEPLLAEIETLSDANRQRPDPEVSRRLLRLRHRAGARLAAGARASPRHPDPSEPPQNGTALPEVAPGEVTPELLRAGILQNGCLLVRGLIPRSEALHLAEEIDRAFAAAEAQASGGGSDDGYYEEFVPDPPFQLENREWITGGGGIWAADSPKVFSEMLDAFERAGLQRLATAYLGERPAISVNKCTLRRVNPDTGTGWHQDGAFLGDDVRALNVWLSLSRCGDVAPGLDVVPRRLDHIVPTGTEGALFDWSVSQAVAERSAGDAGVIRPVFEPGDVLLFDELFLHSTATEPDMPNVRYAIESWFFGPSAFPPDYAPLAF
jgi:hypothetical protein